MDYIGEMLHECCQYVSQSYVDTLHGLLNIYMRTIFECKSCRASQHSLQRLSYQTHVGFLIDKAEDLTRKTGAKYTLFTGLRNKIEDMGDFQFSCCPFKDVNISRGIIQLPRILMISACINLTGQKDMRRFYSEDTLDFGDFVATDGSFTGNSTTYELRAIVIHCGDPGSGHFYVFIKKRMELEK
ncbi:hypothetical protein BGZ65_000021, partial [Modicella reniformis]